MGSASGEGLLGEGMADRGGLIGAWVGAEAVDKAVGPDGVWVRQWEFGQAGLRLGLQLGLSLDLIGPSQK